MKSSAYETGISDFHNMIVTIFKTSFVRGEPKMIHYRCFKSFDESTFETELKDNLSNIENISFEIFYSIFRCTLDKHAPNKRKKVCFNNKRFMSKYLRKAIMTRSRLRNKFNKCRTPDNWKDYTKQRNICT